MTISFLRSLSPFALPLPMDIGKRITLQTKIDIKICKFCDREVDFYWIEEQFRFALQLQLQSVPTIVYHPLFCQWNNCWMEDYVVWNVYPVTGILWVASVDFSGCRIFSISLQRINSLPDVEKWGGAGAQAPRRVEQSRTEQGGL